MECCASIEKQGLGSRDQVLGIKRKVQEKLKRLRLWLCSSRQLLRGSRLRGDMYRHSLLVRSLLSQCQTPTDISQRSRFFRVWWFRGSPRRTHHPVYFGPATISCQPFRPSTKPILLQPQQLSTPKVGANSLYFAVRIFCLKRNKILRLPCQLEYYSEPIHTFFTGP